jgi:hypothetical protein
MPLSTELNRWSVPERAPQGHLYPLRGYDHTQRNIHRHHSLNTKTSPQNVLRDIEDDFIKIENGASKIFHEGEDKLKNIENGVVDGSKAVGKFGSNLLHDLENVADGAGNTIKYLPYFLVGGGILYFMSMARAR